jgi:type IX secretion system PorP/SprF family membrane protein
MIFFMKRLLSIVSVSVLSLSAQAQDIHFSQFYENAIMRNPALTGIFSGDYKAGVNYRSQWSSISVPFQTVLASAETRVAVNKEVGDYISFGITTTYDHAGTINFNSIQVYPAINYNKAIEDVHGSYLSLGFAGGFLQRSIDLTKSTFSSQYTAGGYSSGNASGENLFNAKIINYDMSAGVSLNSSAGSNNNINYYIGAAAYHMTKPKHTFSGQEAFIRLNTKWTGNFGLKYNIDEQYAIVTHFNYSTQNTYQEIIGGAMASWRSVDANMPAFTLSGGVFVRYKDAIIPTLKVDYKEYAFTLSYDVNTSRLRTASNAAGGFEFSLFARGNYKKDAPQAQTKCPRFEMMMPDF